MPNPRETLARIVEDNPQADEKELRALFIETVLTNRTPVLETIVDYWFRNNLRSLKHHTKR